MTVNEVIERIIKGECLSDMFEFTDGQDCIIYKGDWNPGDEVIYIPDIDLNEICINRQLIKILDEEEINDILSCLYTGKDFMNLADGDEKFAKRLFYYVDWQHPSSALDEVGNVLNEVIYDEEDEEEIREEYRKTNFPELNEYYDNDGDLYRDLNREDDGTDIEEIGRYEIIFDVDKQRYYCFVDAINMNEALGIFYKNHPHITYEMIVDHMEV